MTELNKNIVFSCAFHIVLIASVFIIGSGVREATHRILNPYINIILIESLTEKESGRITKNAEKYDNTKLKNVSISSSEKNSNYNPSLESISLSIYDNTLLTKDKNDDNNAMITNFSVHSKSVYSSDVRGIASTDASIYSSSINNNYSLSKLPDASNRQAYSLDNYKTIRALIEKSLIYPSLARKRKIEGTVVTEFSINAAGLPENIKITKSSGFSILDSAAEKTIIKASPFPVVAGRIEIPITFRLE